MQVRVDSRWLPLVSVEWRITLATGGLKEFLVAKDVSAETPVQEKGIDATRQISESPNSKVIIIGGGESGMPLILGNQ